LKNFIISQDMQYSSQVLDDLRAQVSAYNTEYDAMINLTGVGQSPAQLSLKSDGNELFEEWDRLCKSEM
jgi:hypothetical protein